jgi:hypothetical protein
MIPEIDIWRAASLMLKRYGEKALEENNAVSYFITTAGHSSFETETDTRSGHADYERKTEREIPVVVLDPIG